MSHSKSEAVGGAYPRGQVVPARDGHQATSGAGLVLAVIPARAGSKGLLGKNLRLLGGRSLVGRAIDAARGGLETSARVVVSTEDPATASHAVECGAEVPFLRPAELATDEAKTIDVLIHAVEWMRAEASFLPEWVVLLQPTSPLRSSEDVQAALSRGMDLGADCAVSVCEAKQHPFWALSRDGSGCVRLFLGGDMVEAERRYPRRQDLPPAYFENGAVYAVRTASLIRNRSLYAGKVVAYVMPSERSVDIDDARDFRIAEAILEDQSKNA